MEREGDRGRNRRGEIERKGDREKVRERKGVIERERDEGRG